jgi:hypothetical protein
MLNTCNYSTYTANKSTVISTTPISLDLDAILSREINHGYVLNFSAGDMLVRINNGDTIYLPAGKTLDMKDSCAHIVVISTTSVSALGVSWYLK